MDRGRGRDGGEGGWRPPPIRLAAPGTVSCRVPFLAFLIHQRFSNKEEPVISSGGMWPTALYATCTPTWMAGCQGRRAVRSHAALHRLLPAVLEAGEKLSWPSWQGASRAPSRPKGCAAGAALPAVQEQRKPKGIDLAEEDRKGEEGATEISPGGTPSSAVSCGPPPATSASWPSRSRGSTP